MKACFVFMVSLIMAKTSYSQSIQLPPRNRINHKSNVLNDKGDLIRTSVQPNNLRDVVQVPINETDSTYDAVNEVWTYTQDGTHLYYTNSCKDSVITYTINGILSSRDILKWDSTSVFQIYDLVQTWSGTDWVNSTENETPVQYGCYIDYEVYKAWNGISWDTTLGIKEDLTFDIYSRISERHYYRYTNHQWVTYRIVYPHYNEPGDTLIGIDEFRYSTSTGQLTSVYRDTNYVWLSFSSFCHNTPLEYLHQTYDLSLFTWNNASKFQYLGKEINGTDTVYNYLNSNWNGTSYDSSYRWHDKYDYTGYLVEYADEFYDSSSHAWVIDYSYQYNNNYGLSDELLRTEYISFDCAPNFDMPTPCYVHLYSNFTSCDVATGSSELNPVSAHLSVFPNPVQDDLIIQSTWDLSDGDIAVYDVWGRKMEAPNSFQNKTAQINTASLRPGIYIVEVTDRINAIRTHVSFVKE